MTGLASSMQEEDASFWCVRSRPSVSYKLEPVGLKSHGFPVHVPGSVRAGGRQSLRLVQVLILSGYSRQSGGQILSKDATTPAEGSPSSITAAPTKSLP